MHGLFGFTVTEVVQLYTCTKGWCVTWIIVECSVFTYTQQNEENPSELSRFFVNLK